LSDWADRVREKTACFRRPGGSRDRFRVAIEGRFVLSKLPAMGSANKLREPVFYDWEAGTLRFPRPDSPGSRNQLEPCLRPARCPRDGNLSRVRVFVRPVARFPRRPVAQPGDG